METPYIKSLKEKYAASIKKAIAKENAKLNNIYKEFSLSIFEETQNNEVLKEMLLSHTKINESFQKLFTAFKQSNQAQNLESKFLISSIFKNTENLQEKLSQESKNNFDRLFKELLDFKKEIDE
ncbi:hypothetical protein [Helicobacter bilis]|uniref:hypothetical protein n=1 Tax=Helicobacter bilis TaxID=37372 RepID=UPI001F2117D5|nr:hypothetical protein [Helicobacter bilis]